MNPEGSERSACLKLETTQFPRLLHVQRLKNPGPWPRKSETSAVDNIWKYAWNRMNISLQNLWRTKTHLKMKPNWQKRHQETSRNYVFLLESHDAAPSCTRKDRAESNLDISGGANSLDQKMFLWSKWQLKCDLLVSQTLWNQHGGDQSNDASHNRISKLRKDKCLRLQTRKEVSILVYPGWPQVRLDFWLMYCVDGWMFSIKQRAVFRFHVKPLHPFLLLTSDTLQHPQLLQCVLVAEACCIMASLSTAH